MRPAPKAKKVLYKRLSIKSRKRTADGRWGTGDGKRQAGKETESWRIEETAAP
jgi:hypothetical protein